MATFHTGDGVGAELDARGEFFATVTGKNQSPGVDMNKYWSFGALVAALLVAFTGCNWQLPEEVNFRARPQVWVPTGSAVFELNEIIDLDEIADEFGANMQASDVGFTAGALPGGPGTVFTLFAEFGFDTGQFNLDGIPPGYDGFEVGLAGEFDPIDLSEVFGPLPEAVEITSVPGSVTLVANVDAGGTVSISLRITASWDNGNETRTLVPDQGSDPVALQATVGNPGVAAFDLAEVFNERPEDLVIFYEFATTAGDLDAIESLTLRFEVPFAFTAPPGSYLEFDDEDDPEADNPLVFDEDIFGRDPADPDEELDELLDALRGSSASLYLLMENTAGFSPELRLIDSACENVDRALCDAVITFDFTEGDTLTEFSGGLSASVIDTMIDAGEFLPEFVIVLPEVFQLNNNGEFRIQQGFLRVQANVDYRFDLRDDE